jgi:hypothetical protein
VSCTAWLATAPVLQQSDHELQRASTWRQQRVAVAVLSGVVHADQHEL